MMYRYVDGTTVWGHFNGGQSVPDYQNVLNKFTDEMKLFHIEKKNPISYSSYQTGHIWDCWLGFRIYLTLLS